MIKFICWQKKNFIISTRESEIVRNFDQNGKNDNNIIYVIVYIESLF